jgi:pimeloyl-ACP methyl ester carboxylesterase
LLLLGFQQNLAMWARVAPILTADFTVVCADLRGDGDPSKPTYVPDRANYSFPALPATTDFSTSVRRSGTQACPAGIFSLISSRRRALEFSPSF